MTSLLAVCNACLSLDSCCGNYRLAQQMDTAAANTRFWTTLFTWVTQVAFSCTTLCSVFWRWAQDLNAWKANLQSIGASGNWQGVSIQVRSQTIHLLHILETGKLVLSQKIGPHCWDDDALAIEQYENGIKAWCDDHKEVKPFWLAPAKFMTMVVCSACFAADHKSP